MTWEEVENLYKIGKQPCSDFQRDKDPEDEKLVYEHCCFYCGSLRYVSWCINCNDWHHMEGAENCNFEKILKEKNDIL